MSARFVVTWSALSRKRVTYALEYGPPKFDIPRELRKRRVTVELTDEGEALLDLSGAIALFEAGALQGSWLYHRPDPPKLKAPGARAFARYRERMTTWPAKGPPPDYVGERQRIIRGARARLDACRAVGEFCRELGVDGARWLLGHVERRYAPDVESPVTLERSASANASPESTEQG